MSPLWISHRGFKAEAVENTIEAFRASMRLGFKALETDLRLSSDGHIVLSHDPDLARAARRSGIIAHMTRRELEAVELPRGARLLFLDEFFAEFKDASWTFDIKPETGAATLRALRSWVQEQHLEDRIPGQARFLTWKRRHETLLKQLFPGAVSYAREPECWRAGIALLTKTLFIAGLVKGRTYSLPPRIGRIPLFKEEYVAALHRHGARALAFLPETDEDTRDALRCGFDEILTNGRPDSFRGTIRV